MKSFKVSFVLKNFYQYNSEVVHNINFLQWLSTHNFLYFWLFFVNAYKIKSQIQLKYIFLYASNFVTVLNVNAPNSLIEFIQCNFLCSDTRFHTFLRTTLIGGASESYKLSASYLLPHTWGITITRNLRRTGLEI